MAGSDHITFRAEDSLRNRLDDVAERYEMDRSKLLRLIVDAGVDQIEREGIDSVVENDDDVAEQPAN